ncbi:MAG: hypothetical protein GF353_28790, partial [Candidatus Lokiarchaeota archaeon]|nr:hypothetical protein [Candidatus Lokiarchaeota archaeon]
MEKVEAKPVAIVKSPARDVNYREGNGFSLSEIKEAGKSIELLKKLDIKIDYFRKSTHEQNVNALNKIENPKKKGKKREPFVKKEKKIKKKPKVKAKPKAKKEVKPKKAEEKPKEKKPPKSKKEKPAKKEKPEKVEQVEEIS